MIIQMLTCYYCHCLQVVKLLLPSITRSLFQALKCKEYDAGDEHFVEVLLADHAVDCRSSSYTSMQVYAVVMIALLPVGLGLAALVGLWQLRHVVREVDQDAMDNHPRLMNSPLRPLFADYNKGVALWYDVLDMGRRLVLTCVTGELVRSVGGVD